MDPYDHWANNTKHDFISAVKRAFGWAEAEGLIEKYPLAHVKKPAREAREMAVSASEYARVIETVKEPCFRDLLELSWETGARAGNVSLILLPPYSPELNPVENLWHFLRSHDWSNRVYGGYEELREEAVRSLCRVCPDAERMRTVCAADYVALSAGN